jgi:serine/threonine protein kinase/tetratricopeptide (TPR) repeat protein
MNTLNVERNGSDHGSHRSELSHPQDPGTVRIWAGSHELPAEMNLEPAAAILENLQANDPKGAERLGKTLEQFPMVGATIAGFELVALLGRGTFGRVYLARQEELAERFVALKVSTDLSGESRALARLQHTNIVPIYSVHAAPPFQTVCMPYFGATTLGHLLRRIRGSSAVPSTGRQLVDTLKVLNDETVIPTLEPRTGDGTGPPTFNPSSKPGVASEPYVRPNLGQGPTRLRGPLDHLRKSSYPDAVCWIGARLADGLEHAHAQGILHNDLKPANVLLTDEGQPMLLDFGVSDDLALRVTSPGAPVGGTLPYMAPEHLRSVRDRIPATDARSDIYALGLILFEMLTGDNPFAIPTGSLEEELPKMLAERNAAPPRLRKLNPAVTPGLEAIVRKCLEASPDRRYQSGADLRDDLDRHRTGMPLLHVGVPSIRERLQKWAGRHPKMTSNMTVGTTAAALLVLCVIGFSARQARLEKAGAEAVALQAEYRAEVISRQFGDDLKEAQYLLAARPPEPAILEKGTARCEAALAHYGLPADEQWNHRPDFQALPPEEQRQVQGRLAEACVLLARGYSLRAGEVNDAMLENALRVNEWAGRLSGDAAPRAVWDQRADLLRRLGRTAEAAQVSARATEIPLKTADDFYLSGTGALSQGRHKDALRLLRRSAELNPSSFWTHLAQGLGHEGIGQYREAASCYTTAIALWPGYPGGYHSRGLVELRLRDYSAAKADLDRAASMVPDTADLFLNRSLANQGLKDYPAALEDLSRALELSAPRARVLLMRARVHELAGNKEEARKDLADGLREAPTDELGWIARGVARLGSDLAGAIADFDSALTLNPRSLSAMQNKAHALSKMDKNQDAILVLDQLLERYPDYVPGRAGRGVLNARVGNEKAALADAVEAIRLDSAPSNLYQAAGIYALLGKQPGSRAEAIRLLTAALRAGFGFEYVETDKDLDPIRGTPEFKQVIDGVRALNPEKPGARESK